MSAFKLLFSDIDGTCVHYQDSDEFEIEEDESLEDGRLVRVQFKNHPYSRVPSSVVAMLLPPSSSGEQGIISLRTIQCYAAIRALGRKVVLISGCRYSTLIQRLPYLPAADAYVCESGGRIFYPDSSIPTAVGLKEDMEWRNHHSSVAGMSTPPQSDEKLVEYADSNTEWGLLTLWNLFTRLKKEGLTLDRNNYSTAFRVRIPRQRWQDAYADELDDSLAYAENLGSVDIFPATSGKKNAAFYLMEKFEVKTDGQDSVFMCDDDNDIELAQAVRNAYLPSITSDTMQQIAEQNPAKFTVAGQDSVLATEEILQQLLEEVLEELD
jgi:hydroxymethylpyrimidine pyrophosphatase-like HAD family hydrolase